MDRRKLLVMDTGPLWELIVFQAVSNLGFTNLRRDVKFLTEKSLFDKLAQYVGSFQTKCTTGAVIAELGYWVSKTKFGGQEQLWSLIYDEFVKWD